MPTSETTRELPVFDVCKHCNHLERCNANELKVGCFVRDIRVTGYLRMSKLKEGDADE